MRNFYRFYLLLSLLLFTSLAYGQRTVTGTVTDSSSGEGLVGVNVVVSGTSNGTSTDIDGNFSIKLSEGETQLEVSYIGYETQTVDATGSVVDVALVEGSVLDEVVVIGYGTVKKRDITGSVATLKPKDFNQGIVVSSDQLLQGRIPGVNMVNNSGQPGGLATVKIRGNNSIRAGADPLYVVDGVPLDGRTAKPSFSASDDIGTAANSNPLNFLNPADVASIEVLKDASSAAIYGSRASNGVILITTKKARAGKTDVNFNANFGTSSVLKKYDVLTGDEYRSALNSYGLTGDGGSSTDAFDEITRNGFIQNYNLSLGTGGDDHKIRFSAGYQDIKGIIEKTGIKRYSGALNAQYELLDDKAGIDVFLVSSHTVEDIAPIGTSAGFRGNLIGQALQWNPTIPLMTDGEFTTGLNNTGVGATTINPLQMLDAYSETANSTTILGSISPYINITEGLTYRYRFAVNYGVGTTRGSIGKDLNLEDIETLGLAATFTNILVTNLHTHTLSYNTEVADNFSLGLLGGYEYQKFNFKGQGFSGVGFDNVPDGFDLSNILQNSNNDNRSVFSFAEPVTELQSYFARATLGIGDRFDITATVRADGSTKFGENNNYGIFPSFAARWNVINESFIAGGAVFDDLALRIGWGVTGNQEFPAGSSVDRFALNPNGGISQENIGNPDLKWEESTTLNFGLDFAVFDYKLAGTIEYYTRTTNNLLLDPFVQEPGPPIRAWRNIDGELVNSGLELGLKAFLIQKSNLSLNIGVNMAFLNNELRNYTGPDILTGNLFGQGSSGAFVQKHVNGMPLNTFFVREYTGLDSDLGTSTYSNDGELVALGDPNADIILGASVGLDVGDISFNMNWNGAFGHQLYNNTAMSVIPIGNLGSRNIDAALITDGTLESIANPITSSSRYLEDGDFVKLANATLAYNLGSISGIGDISLSLTGQNLLIITNYSGFDPEINTVNLRNGVPSAGIEYIPYPSARSVLFGINISF